MEEGHWKCFLGVELQWETQTPGPIRPRVLWGSPKPRSRLLHSSFSSPFIDAADPQVLLTQPGMQQDTPAPVGPVPVVHAASAGVLSPAAGSPES